MPGQFTVLRETRLDPAFPLARRELEEVLEAIMDSLGLDGAVILKLVGDAEIARLNAEFMGCTGPTNILSFPAEEESPTETGDVVFLGELALSVDTLAREADLFGQPPHVHLARLLAHGLLHLAGYDHGEIMDDLTEQAVDRILLETAV